MDGQWQRPQHADRELSVERDEHRENDDEQQPLHQRARHRARLEGGSRIVPGEQLRQPADDEGGDGAGPHRPGGRRGSEAARER